MTMRRRAYGIQRKERFAEYTRRAAEDGAEKGHVGAQSKLNIRRAGYPRDGRGPPSRIAARCLYIIFQGDINCARL